MKIAENLIGLIGNTPLVHLNYLPGPDDATILAKLESYNPGGSIKDRIGYAMIADAEERGFLKPDCTIVEPTAGNTGIGLSIVAIAKGYRVTLDHAGERQSGKVYAACFFWRENYTNT